MSDSQEQSGDLTAVAAPDALRIDFDALGTRDDQCGWHYPGAAGRCPEESEYVAFWRTRNGDSKEVPLCEKHAKEAGADV